MIKHYCDRCSQEIKDYTANQNSIGTKGFHDGWENDNYFIAGGDLCGACRLQFRDDFMKNREARPKFPKKKRAP